MRKPILLMTAVFAAAAVAGTLSLRPAAAPTGVKAADVLDAGHPVWEKAAKYPLHLSRTPPLYSDGPYDDGLRPEAAVRLVRLGGGEIAVRADWSDATLDKGGKAARYPDAGEKPIYKEHSQAIETFPDAFCVMAPRRRGKHTTYPSLMMGDKANPVEMFFWAADGRAQVLVSHGRETPDTTKTKLAVKGERTATGWTVIMVVPNLTPDTPVAFAIWDGSKQHRDGIKYFTIWHEVR